MKRLVTQIAHARSAILVAALGLAFLGLLAWGELTAWHTAVARIEQETENLALALAQHADDSLELAQAPLAELVRELEEHDGTPMSPEKLEGLMQGMLEASTRLTDLYIFDENGDRLATSARLVRSSTVTNNSDREYFQFHQKSRSTAMHLGVPVLSRATGEWVIPLSRRFNHADGSFAGVVTATFESRYFSDYYQGAPIGTDGAILLMRGDGLIMARTPFVEDLIGLDISADQLFVHQLRAADAGAYRYMSPIDGVMRIGGYYRSWRSQLVVVVAVSEAEALAQWAGEARPRWTAGVVAVFVTLLLSLLLAHQNKKKRQSEELLKRTEAEFRMMAENSSDMVERIDAEGFRLYVSPSAKRVVGRDPQDMVGHRAFDRAHADDRAYLAEARRKLTVGESCTVTFRAENEAGEQIWLETSLNALPLSADGEHTGAVAVTRDVTTRKHLEARLAEMATVDGLTGLANRRAFDERLAQEFRRTRRERSLLSVLMIDADRFKLFNDTYGHIAGDNCLKAISAAISQQAQRPADFTARFGGEEIVVLLPGTDSFGAMKLAERMCAAIYRLGIAHEKNLPWGVVTVSVGVATYADVEGVEMSETSLIEAADRALYSAKMGGRNQVVLAQPPRPVLSLTGS